MSGRFLIDWKFLKGVFFIWGGGGLRHRQSWVDGVNYFTSSKQTTFLHDIRKTAKKVFHSRRFIPETCPGMKS